MEMEKYTDRAKGFLQSAQTMALRRGHPRLPPEHTPQAAAADLDKLPRVEGSGAGQVYMSPELARVFEQAEQLAKRAGDNFVTVERLLLALAAGARTGGAG